MSLANEGEAATERHDGPRRELVGGLLAVHAANVLIKDGVAKLGDFGLVTTPGWSGRVVDAGLHRAGSGRWEARPRGGRVRVRVLCLGVTTLGCWSSARSWASRRFETMSALADALTKIGSGRHLGVRLREIMFIVASLVRMVLARVVDRCTRGPT
jgi:hypothetical protein